MASVINFNTFTFSAEQIRDINELVYDELLHAPDIDFIHQMYSGIVYDKEIGFIGGSGLVGKAGQGCSPSTQEWNISTRKVLWQPKEWEIFIDECASEIKQTAAVYALNKHTRVDDLTDTDYMAIIVKVLTDAVKDFMYRLIWFNDTEAANYTAGGSGIITAGVDTGYFKIIDGLFKQLETAVSGGAASVTISANAAATKDAQLSGMTTDAAYKLLSDMYYKAPVQMRGKGAMRFLVTQTVADAYQQYLTDKGIESTYKNLVDGVESLSFLGVPVVAMPIWDSMIQAYNDLGTTYYKPHRALLVEKANLAVGTPSEEAYGEFDIWYDKTSRKNYVLIKDKLDAKLLDTKRLVYGF